jgi:quercetin dioxygenase-like cupin family protein
MATWTLLHLFNGDDGVSRVDAGFMQHLEAIAFAPPAPPMQVRRASDAEDFVLVELPVGWHGGWHPSPKSQWVICLAGVMEYEAGDGTRFTLRPGDCVLTTDTTGKRHASWNEGSGAIRLALVQMQAAPPEVVMPRLRKDPH